MGEGGSGWRGPGGGGTCVHAGRAGRGGRGVGGVFFPRVWSWNRREGSVAWWWLGGGLGLVGLGDPPT